MADWQRKIDLTPEWQRAEDGGLSLCDMAAVVRDRLKALKPFGIEDIDERRQQLVEWFDELAAGRTDVGHFDEAMAELYDWGDLPIDDSRYNPRGKKCCWISTIPRSLAAKQEPQS